MGTASQKVITNNAGVLTEVAAIKTSAGDVRRSSQREHTGVQ